MAGGGTHDLLVTTRSPARVVQAIDLLAEIGPGLIEQGKISGQDVLARFAAALGGRFHQAIYFDDGNIVAIG